MKKSRYSVIIQWSEEDHAYVVTLPEWGGCHTHGATYVEAAKNAQEVLDSLIECELEAGRDLPPAHEFMYPGPSGFTYELSHLAPSALPERGDHHRIEALLDELASADDQNAKKAIRAKLRSLGHYGASRTPPRVMSKTGAQRYRRSSAQHLAP